MRPGGPGGLLLERGKQWATNMIKVVEKDNPHAVHCVTWSVERAQQWVDRTGDSGLFADKTLNKDSFCVVVEAGY